MKIAWQNSERFFPHGLTTKPQECESEADRWVVCVYPRRVTCKASHVSLSPKMPHVGVETVSCRRTKGHCLRKLTSFTFDANEFLWTSPKAWDGPHHRKMCVTHAESR